MKTTKKGVALGCCLALVLFICASPLSAAESEPKVGQVLGPVTFSPPLTAEDAKYLGLDKQRPFTLKDVKSPYILIEQFNTSCPHCMHEAPFMNQLFGMVQQDPALKGKLKFLGAGQGNDQMPVMLWKGFHKVPFPVVPDPNSNLGKALNFTPYPINMIVDQSGKLLWVHIGAFDNPNDIFKEIQAAIK